MDAVRVPRRIYCPFYGDMQYTSSPTRRTYVRILYDSFRHDPAGRSAGQRAAVGAGRDTYKHVIETNAFPDFITVVIVIVMGILLCPQRIYHNDESPHRRLHIRST